MRFFSGFCFQNERELFASFADLDAKYTLSGFSYGAIKAFQNARECIQNGRRIQTLNLFSPAFFQDRDLHFLNTQIAIFKRNPQKYIHHFLTLCENPHKQYTKEGKLQELEELLFFQWDQEELDFLQRSGVHINVFIGGRDRILNSEHVMEFFSPFCVTYLYKNLNHRLSFDHP